MSARRVAAQRAHRSGPSLKIPKGRGPLRSVPLPASVKQVRNDHKANRGGKAKG